MRKYLLAILASLVLCVPLVFAASFSDDFNRADNADLGANWDSGYSGYDPLQIVGNRIRATQLNVDAIETVNAISAANDQFAQVEIIAIAQEDTGDSENDVWVISRAAAPSTDTKYACIAYKFRAGDSITTHLGKFVSGSFTELASETTTTWAVGDVLKITSQGTTHKCFQNGVQVLSSTDGAIASGRIGVGLTLKPNNSIGDLEADDFQGGDLAGVTARARRRPIQW